MISCLIVGLLLAVSALFWTPPAWAESGEMLFNDNCVGCHQVGGTGVPGEYPRLAGRVSAIASNAKGRAFLAQLMVTGMSGTISVDGRKILGIMPGFGELKDNELAAVLNYVVGLGGRKGPAFTPGDVRKARLGPEITPEGMAATRNLLSGAHVIP